MLIYFYWPVKAGGAENQCKILAEELKQEGLDCLIVTGRHDISIPGNQVEKGVRIVRRSTFETLLQRLMIKPAGDRGGKEEQSTIAAKVDTKPPSRVYSFFSSLASKTVKYCNTAIFGISVLLYLLKNKRSIDVLHVHTAEWIAGLAALAGSWAGIPVVCKGADIPVFPVIEDVPVKKFFDRWRRKPHFIALTQAMKRDLLKNGVPESRITVIPNGVQLPGETAQVANNKNFLYIGNFSQTAAHKGFDILIKAWSRVCCQRPGVRLIMLGGGEADTWIDFARQSGCLDAIEFAGYRDDLAPYFLTACCLLLPSRKEGISNALLEAQSWGIPAIVSDIPGNREVVKHQENGIIVPVEDYIGLAEACTFLIDSPDVRAQYGKAARRRMEDIFDMEKITTVTVKLYEKMVVPDKYENI
jgi:glycosyltransferase involved in cell wall biosynthesis